MKTRMLVGFLAVGGVVLTSTLGWALDGPARGALLPAFSEEREVAALHFAKKHAPDLVPILEKLKTADQRKYETEVCELFQTCEWLTDFRRDDEQRYVIELDIWKTETKSYLLVARLAGLPEEDREKHKEELRECAKKLVELEMLIMRHRIDALEKELGEARDTLSKTEEQREHIAKDRYNKLFEEAKKRGMMR